MTGVPNKGHRARPPDGAGQAPLLVAALLVALCGSPALAQQERWNPFRDDWSAPAPPRSDRRSAGSPRGAAAQRDVGQTQPAMNAPFAGFVDEVERGELAPVPGAATGAQGSENAASSLAALLDGLELPLRSPALSVLFRRVTAGIADATPHLVALKAEALWRAGLLAEGDELFGRNPAADRDARLLALRARYDLALGRHDRACAAARAANARRAELAPALRAEMITAQGYCAAAAGDKPGAGLAAGLAREEGSVPAHTLAALEAVAYGQKLRPSADDRLSPLDYRLLRLTGAAVAPELAERAEPALLAALVLSPQTGPELVVAAAEAAARANAIGPARLAEAYRRPAFAADVLTQPLAAPIAPVLRRALLFQVAETERSSLRKARAVRALADEARRNGLYLPVLAMLAGPVEAMAPTQEIGWFAETAVEVLLAAGRFERAASWAAFGGIERRGAEGLSHWLALIDIADRAPAWRRGEYLAALEELALRGRFGAEALVRLATVLDALDYQVPVRLWEAAARNPQPGGYLPETGVLSELQGAARSGDRDRTVLFAIRTLGPAGPEGAHVIALADTIRALKQVGLEADARRIGFEALFAGWPRTVHN